MNDGNAELTRWRHAAPAWPVQGTCPNVFLDDTIVPAEKRSAICHRPICGIPSSSRVYPSGAESQTHLHFCVSRHGEAV